MGYATRDDLEESLLPWVVAEDEEATPSYAQFEGQSLGLRVPSGTTGPPPAFEATLPSPGAPGQQGFRSSAGGGSWEGSGGVGPGVGP